MSKIDWSKSCSYDAEQKAKFHRQASAALKQLADELGFAAGSYDLRSNKGGIAVSGEITLHHDKVYVQAFQSVVGGPTNGVLIRTCNGRKDYTGGRNNTVSLEMLDDIRALAAKVKQVYAPRADEDAEPTAEARLPRF